MSTRCAIALVFLSGCASRSARTPVRTLDSTAMGKPMRYAVYTPPGWTPSEALPLFVFLHGGGGDDVDCLDHEGVAAALDAEISAGRLGRVTVVVPQGDRGFWANWADGTHRYEDWVLDDLLPVVAKELGAPPCPGGCHVLGISMGGNGALRFVLARPQLFASVGIISGPTLDAKGMDAMMNDWFFRTFARLERVFGPVTDHERKRRADPFQRWRSPADTGQLRIFVAHGTRDRAGLEETNRAFHRHLEGAGIAHRHHVFEGGHRWSDWTPVFFEAIRHALGTGP